MLICQLTDLHVRPEGVAANRVVESNMMVERALRAVAVLDPAPDAIVISGDLADCGLDSEYVLLTGLLRTSLRMPVYVVPGNHDRRERVRAHLGFLPGVLDDPDFVQYAVEDHAVRLVMLDTVVPGAGHGLLCPVRLAFLERTLAARSDRPTVVVMHHPPFRCGIPHMDRINLHNAEDFAAVIARHRQVALVVCGHHHRPITTMVAHAPCVAAPAVAHQAELDLHPEAPPRLVLEPSAFALHQHVSGQGMVSHVALVDRFAGPFPYLHDPDYPGAAF